MKISSWNVNGLRAIEKKGFWRWFEETEADIICLQETKADYNQVTPKLQKPPQYHSYWHNGQKKGYSGVLVYTKHAAKAVSRQFHTTPEIFKQEGRILELHFESFILLNIYFPNGNPRRDNLDMLSEKLQFYACFLAHIEHYRSQGKNIIACGDYNIAHTEKDIARPEENKDSIGFLPIERAWISKILESGYTDVFRALNPSKTDSYTWWSYRTRARERNIGWRLDYFIINKALESKLISVSHEEDALGSDHCPIHIEIALDPSKPTDI